MDKFADFHYYDLPSQGSIYTLLNLPVANAIAQVLVGTLKREIFSFEFLDVRYGILPKATEVNFSEIPGGAEIISIDGFNKSKTANNFVIGITLVKEEGEDLDNYYLNIYSEWKESKEFHIERTAQNCQVIKLNYQPFHLLHTFFVYFDNGIVPNKEAVFLLSGGDSQIHIYRENLVDHIYEETDYKEYFPEFTKAPSSVIRVDVCYNKDYSVRLSAICCECGYIRFTKTCVKTNTIQFIFSTKFNDYVSSVKIYPGCSWETNIPKSSKNKYIKQIGCHDEPHCDESVFHLVVVNTILPGVIFKDVLKYGLSNYDNLPRLDSTSIMSSIIVADFDFDGKNELLIGSSARQLMYYKLDKIKGWCLQHVKKLSSPILSMIYTDVNGDGISELVILTMKGLLILEYDFLYLHRMLVKKSKGLMKSLALEQNEHTKPEDTSKEEEDSVGSNEVC